MNNVILIGMPGCGKSTLGVLLAKSLGMTFLDADLVIQDREHALLSQLIRTHGSDGFLALEGFHLRPAGRQQFRHRHRRQRGLRTKSHGPSLPARHRRLPQAGLRKPWPAAWGAWKNAASSSVPVRPSACSMTSRVPLYEKYANITVDCGGQDIEHTLRRVRRALEKQGNVTK